MTLSDLQGLGTVTAEDLARRAAGGPLANQDSILSLLAGRSSAGGQDISILQNALVNAQNVYAPAQDKLAGMKPGDEGYGTQKNFEEAAKAVAMYSVQLQQAQQAQNQLMNGMVQFDCPKYARVQGLAGHSRG